jgi:hypothetical protein
MPKMAFTKVSLLGVSGTAVCTHSVPVGKPAVGWSRLAVVFGLVTLGALGASAQAPQTAPANSTAPTLDFRYFTTKVEPIFLKKREGHARCYICHSEVSRAAISKFRLEVLSPGATFWTDEQSRVNFDNVSKMVIPGDALKSHFVMHTLSKDAGGDFLHQGGKQFFTRDDPDWKILAAWANGAKATNSK